MAAAPTFLERALQEAARYGSDPWVFVRELIQNARDAGARSVAFTTTEGGGAETISCRDDGEGMTFEHARRFLFTLYASSKEGKKGEAGKFGVGFWSLLRFRPDRVVVRSWPRAGEPWEITLDGALTRATRGMPAAARGSGTEILISRAGSDRNLHRRALDAAVQSARYSTRKDDRKKPLIITVDGAPANAPFTLPAPSAAFRRGGVRGVVGLGRAARVELFSKGLRVRSAAALEDLLAPPAKNAGHARVRFPELADGLAPQALLESEELELLLSRGDARESATLTRAVRLAQDELRRLVERQLDLARPASRWRRGRWVMAAAAAGIAGVIAGAWVGGGGTSPERPGAGANSERPGAGAGSGARTGTGTVAGTGTSTDTAYRDLGALYGGPRVDSFDASAAPVALSYFPEDRVLHIAALVLEGGESDGAPRGEPLAAGAAMAVEAACTGAECVRFTMTVAEGPGLMRIPVPTGHRIDPGSIRLNGERLVAFEGRPLPVVRLAAATRGTLAWTTLPLPPMTEKRAVANATVPREIERFARALRALPAEQRITRALAWTQETVRYSTADDVAALHVAATREGRGFLDRSLAIGAGDCDVQNGVLSALLRAAGLDARLAIGFLGDGGTVAPWLHAWVEVRDPRGGWIVVDASEGGAQPRSEGIAVTAPVVARELQQPGGPGSGSRTGERPGTGAGAVTATGAGTNTRTGARVALGAGVAGGLLVVGLLLVLPRRTRRAVTLDGKRDVGGLLQGALLHPAAFESVPAVFERPLVPLIGGGALSLGEAWRRAARSRLYSAHGKAALVARARGLGHPVVDVATPEGAIVAGALAASDLDRWTALLARTRSGEALASLRAVLRAHGEDLEVRSAEGIGALPVVVEIPPAARWRRALGRGVRVAIVDASAPWTRTLGDGRDAQRLLAGADQLFEALGIPAARAAVLLAPLANAALKEAAR